MKNANTSLSGSPDHSEVCFGGTRLTTASAVGVPSLCVSKARKKVMHASQGLLNPPLSTLSCSMFTFLPGSLIKRKISMEVMLKFRD